VADGKKKRSLREAFGVVRPPEEKSAAEPTPGTGTAGPGGAPEGGKPAPAEGEKTEKKPGNRNSSRATQNGGGSRTGKRTTNRVVNGDPVITANSSGKRGGGRGRSASRDESSEPAEEMVPGKGGKMVPAEKPVNMTFTVTARERYLWTLELKRRGLTAVGVLRETMEAMLEEGAGGK
jgi:hypothetical protein